jgi:tRNA(fMet)-specific endonuclease VapC
MGAIVDSSILIAAERGTLDLELIAQESGQLELAMSVITASELLHGVHRAESGMRRARREAYVEAILSKLPVIPFDMLCARIHARLSAELASQGLTVGAHDLIIASTAIANGLDLVTRDERSFPKIPGLSLIRW